ncbi:MAG: 4-hydroxy-tetrahydrodipicolinate synthase [Anaerolineales bacterium]|nr:4-hydroxy-tetrahydrodipicolinate synthase [Anaerolineales bacterium]
MNLRGTYTAIVTPFTEYENVDEGALKKLIDFNLAGGVTGIVPCGTTGESPTLTHDEHDRVIELTVEHVNGRALVLAGTGSNSTREAVRLSKHARKAGADALLLVTPYYNKPTQEGMYRHFREIAESVSIPSIIYNIKGRTGVNLETDTLVRLMTDCANVVGVKEASGDLNQMKDVIARKTKEFCVLSGDDNMTMPLIKAGGDGVISVASNIVPEKMSKMVALALEGKTAEAEALEKELAPLFAVEFVETNPIPIKYMLSLKGMCQERYRLPICELRPPNKEKVQAVMKQMGLL